MQGCLPEAVTCWTVSPVALKAKAPSDGALGALNRGISPDNTPWKETGRTRLEFGALLEVSYYRYRCQATAFRVQGLTFQGIGAMESTSGRMRLLQQAMSAIAADRSRAPRDCWTSKAEIFVLWNFVVYEKSRFGNVDLFWKADATFAHPGRECVRAGSRTVGRRVLVAAPVTGHEHLHIQHIVTVISTMGARVKFRRPLFVSLSDRHKGISLRGWYPWIPRLCWRWRQA